MAPWNGPNYDIDTWIEKDILTRICVSCLSDVLIDGSKNSDEH